MIFKNLTTQLKHVIPAKAGMTQTKSSLFKENLLIHINVIVSI